MSNWHRWQRLVLVAAIGAVVCLTGLGKPALWEPDEGRYGEIAREMLVRGDYVTPRDDWVRYFEKPPLMYWLTAASIRFLGVNEFSARLPAACFSVGQLVISAALSEAMFGARAGLLTALCLGSSPLFFGFSRFLTLDPALAFFVTTGLALWYLAWREKRFSSPRALALLLASSIAAALGTLTKGPIAPFLIAAIGLGFALLKGNARRLKEIPWIPSLAVFSVIVAPWFVLVSLRNPGFLQFFLLHEHVYRYLYNTEHQWGVWFLPLVAIGGLWPWTMFIPIAVVASRKESDANQKDAVDFLLLWAAWVIIFFSASRSKLGSYVLPAMPALAILAARGMVAVLEAPCAFSRRLLFAAAIANCAVALLAASVAIGFTTCAREHLHLKALNVALLLYRAFEKVCELRPLAQVARDLALAVSTLALGGVFAAGLTYERKRLAMLGIILSASITMTMLIKARQDAAPLGSYRTLARAISRRLKAGCMLASYRRFVQSLPFYTGAREVIVGYRGELTPFSWSPDAAGTFITNDSELKSIWESQRCLIVVADRRDRAKLTALLSSPAPQIIGAEGQMIALSNRGDTEPSADISLPNDGR